MTESVQGDLGLEVAENASAGDLPHGWCYATLGELVPKPRSKVDPDPESTLPFIGMDHIEAHSFEISGQDEYRKMKSAGSAFSPGDVLYGRLRPYLNKVHHARFEGVASAEFIVLPKAETHDSDFLKFLLHRLEFVQFATERSSGDRPRVKFDTIAEYEFALPPLAEQRRIVSRIEELFSKIEAGERAIEQARKDLKRYRKAVLKAAVTGALTEDWRAAHPPVETGEALLARILEERREAWGAAEIAKSKAGEKVRAAHSDWVGNKYRAPSQLSVGDNLPELPVGWTWTAAEQLCRHITKGTTPSRNHMHSGSGDIPYLKVYNLTFTGKIDFSVNPTFIDVDVHRRNLKRSILVPNDVVMNIVGPPLGQVGKIPNTYPEWNTNQAVALFRPHEALNPDYLVHVLLTDSILQHAIGKAKATVGQINLTLEICRNLPIPLPPLDEQAEIVSRVEEALSRADAAEATLDEQARAAQALRQSILKAAFTGRLVPQDPNDEPASELLKRVKESAT